MLSWFDSLNLYETMMLDISIIIFVAYTAYFAIKYGPLRRGKRQNYSFATG